MMLPIRLPLLCLMGTLCLVLPCFAADPSLANYKIILERERAVIDEEFETACKNAAGRYGARLATVRENLRKAGDLQGTLAAQGEIDRFANAGTVLLSTPETFPADLMRIHEAYRAAVSTAAIEQSRRLIALGQHYVSRLGELRKRLVQQSKLEDALVVDQEIKRASFVLAEQQAKLATAMVAQPSEDSVGARVAGGAAASLPKSGLVLHYTFDALTEGNVTDQSPKGVTGVVEGARRTPMGRAGGGYEFDGRDDYIDMGRAGLAISDVGDQRVRVMRTLVISTVPTN